MSWGNKAHELRLEKSLNAAMQTQHSPKEVKVSREFVLKVDTKAFKEVVVSRQQPCQIDLVLFGNK